MTQRFDEGDRPPQATTASLNATGPRGSLTFQQDADPVGPPELMGRYRAILGETRLSWIEQHRMLRRLGSGGQGVVYLCERVGSDRFTLPVALKIFSPE